MPHAIWKGSLRFGLVTIPIAVYPAESPDALDFGLLDRRSLQPVGYRKINKATGKELPSSEIVRGYEVSEGRWVVLSDADLKRANPEATQSVDIFAFVGREEIAPLYFDRPYYLAPLKHGEKAYALLREALGRSGRQALARVVLRTRQHVAAVYPLERALVLNLLRFAHELRDTDAYGLPPAGLTKLGLTAKEVEMAERLIDGMVEAWKPEQYKDDYRDDLLALIRRKSKSAGKAEEEEAEAPAARAPKAEVVDLMALLKQSVEQGGRRTRRSAAPARASSGPARPAAGAGRTRRGGSTRRRKSA
jgi:DNA end-binding protein Ku